MVPVSQSAQYVLFWYIAETLPPDLETMLQDKAAGEGMAYQIPPRYPTDLTIADRLKLEPQGFEPVRHENTGVDAEEALYESYLLPIKEAMERLKGTIMADVVRKGWKGIQLRQEMEKKAATNTNP